MRTGRKEPPDGRTGQGDRGEWGPCGQSAPPAPAPGPMPEQPGKPAEKDHSWPRVVMI
jgi:hypothetical protein